MVHSWDTVILKNTTGSDITIYDLYGIIIPANSSKDVSSLLNLMDFALSKKIFDYINNGTIVVNNGSKDLSPSKAVDYVSILSKYRTDEIIATVSGIAEEAKETADETAATVSGIYETIINIENIIEGATTFSGLSDTPDYYEAGKYLKSTASGIEYDDGFIIPTGGLKGQSLVKTSDTSGDVSWEKRASEEFAVAITLTFGGEWA